MLYLAYGIAWLSTGIATSIGIYITKDPTCLWAMLIPAMIGLSTGGSKNTEDSKEKDKVEID